MSKTHIHKTFIYVEYQTKAAFRRFDSPTVVVDDRTPWYIDSLRKMRLPPGEFSQTVEAARADAEQGGVVIEDRLPPGVYRGKNTCGKAGRHKPIWRRTLNDELSHRMAAHNPQP